MFLRVILHVFNIELKFNNLFNTSENIWDNLNNLEWIIVTKVLCYL